MDKIELKALDDFGFIDPVRGKKIKEENVAPKITLNKNFYPEENDNK